MGLHAVFFVDFKAEMCLFFLDGCKAEMCLFCVDVVPPGLGGNCGVVWLDEPQLCSFGVSFGHERPVGCSNNG